MQPVEFLVNGLYPVRFTDADLVNPEAYDQRDAARPHRPGAEKLWLVHEHGQCVCLVISSDESDVLDIACDENKLDKFKIANENLSDYQTNTLQSPDDEPEYDGVTHLGNASEPFDLGSVEVTRIPLPKLSITALLLASGQVTRPKEYNTLPR